jgi:ribosomal protein S6--L-glutamate ligase
MAAHKRKRPPPDVAPPPVGRPVSGRRAGAAVAILSRKRSLYSTARLMQATRALGHRPVVLDTLRCNLLLEPGQARLVYRGVQVRGLGVVIPRIGASITGYGLAVVNHLDLMGVPVVNPAQAIANSRDKLRCLQLLAKNGIDVPRTVMARDLRHIATLVEQVGGLPAIVKLLRGTQGVGVMIASSMKELEGLLGTFSTLGQEIVVQEFVAESKGRDIRALVVGDKVVGAMRRTAKKGEFRSNLHRGGRGKPLTLPKRYAEAAVKAARVVGLEICGVDLLEGKDGPKVLELNSSPGFEGLERATGKDIARAMVEHALGYAARKRREEFRRSMMF